MTQNIVEVPIDNLLEPETPVRLNPNDESILELAESIKTLGLLQPILVRPEGDKYRVVAGHRRFLACRVAGLEKVPCIIDQHGKEKELEVMLAENIARKDMSPIEEAAFFKEAIDKLGHTPKSLAETIGRSRSYVVQRLRLLEYPPEIQKAVHEGKIKVGAAEVLAQIDDAEVRNRYLQDAIERGVSVKTLELWRDIYEQNKQFREAGATDPRQMEYTMPESHLYGRCELCGEQRLFGDLASMILCSRCRKLIALFWEEYKKGLEQEQTE